MFALTAIQKLLLAGALLVLLPAAAFCDNFAAQMGAGYAGLRLSLDQQGVQLLTMQQRTNAAQEGIEVITESLLEANATAQRLAERNQELEKQIAALGMSRVTEDKALLEQRLLKAVRDMELLDERYRRSIVQLESLVTNVEAYFSAPENMKRDEFPKVVEAIGASKNLLNNDLSTTVQGNALTGNLNEMRVLDVKDDLALVIINAGARQGVTSGMQFIVQQGGRRIGSVRAVDVRDGIAGCIIQDFESANTPMEAGQEVVLDVRS